MTSVSWKLTALGVLGYTAFFFLFPRDHPSGNYGLTLSRAAAVERSREIARQAGLDVESWPASATATLNLDSIWYLRQRPEQAGPFLWPVRTRVRLSGPDRDFVTLDLSPGGDLARFEKRRPTRADDIDEEEVQVRPERIEWALRLLAGDSWERYSPSRDPEVRDRITTLVYEAPGLAGPDRKPAIRIQAVGREIYLVAGSPGFSEAVTSTRSDREDVGDFVMVLLVLSSIGLVVAGLARYSLAVYDHSAKLREMLVLIGIVVVLDGVRFFLGEAWQQTGLEGNGIFSAGFEFLAKSLFLTAPLLIGTAGAGAVVADSSAIPHRIDLDLLLQGKFFHRPLGRALLLGGLSAGVLLCVPHLLLGLFPGQLLEHHDPGNWYSLLPWVTVLDWYPEGVLLPAFGVIALLFPWLSLRISRTWLGRLLGVLLLGFFLSRWAFQYSMPGGLLAGILAGLILDWLYRKSGLLAVVGCGILVSVFRNGMEMVLQPAPSLALNGALALATGFGLLLLFALVAVRGAELDVGAEIRSRVEEVEARLARRRGERERLLAEFGVARRAQEMMLPAQAPSLPGVDIAAICRPAREVGGDLFDYLEMADGRVGIAVADVSGKGVPAALYMTLAKGLLSSSSIYHGSPQSIIAEVNEHFRGCARRRVFATLALAVLDPARGVVHCARAGHNPILWWQSATRKLHTVNPSGIGLGLAPNRLLTRSLGVQECPLAAGDVLIVYSDGIPEAMNEAREQYGMERFEQAIVQTEGMAAAEIRNYLLDHVRDFVADNPPSDDITLVVLKFSAGWNSTEEGTVD